MGKEKLTSQYRRTTYVILAPVGVGRKAMIMSPQSSFEHALGSVLAVVLGCGPCWKRVGHARRCTPASRVYTRPAWPGTEISSRHVQACLGARPGRSLSIKRPSLASSPGGRATFELTCRRAFGGKRSVTG